MICLDEGILRAYLDGELTQYEMLSVNRHLGLCEDCRHRQGVIAARRISVSSLFDDLAPQPHELRTDEYAAQWAFTRFKANYDAEFVVPQRPVFVRELHLLLSQEGLLQRLQRAWLANWQDFKRDPQGFFHYLWHGETLNPMRRRRLQTGTAMAMASYVLIFTTLLVAGAFRTPPPVNELPAEKFKIINLASPPPTKSKPLSPPEYAKAGKDGLTGGDKIQSDPAHGGGGGGNNELTPATKGRVPQMVPNPQLMPPRPQPATIERPTLVVPETLVGSKYLYDARAGRTGLPDAVDAAPSSGTGKGAGMGEGQGTGMGSGDGKGFGPGLLNNKGNGAAEAGGGLGNNDNVGTGAEIFDATDRLRPTIISRERAAYTDEAQLHRAQGTVLLSAIFSANKQILQIQVVRGLPYGLSESAILAAKKIKFQPAMRNGVPVNVRMTLQYDFNLF